MSAGEKIRCDACPVLCYIAEGRTGACDRYANVAGELTRVDPLVIIDEAQDKGTPLVPFAGSPDWDGDIVRPGGAFVTAIGAGTTYPDYKPAPFIVSSRIDGVDMVTVVSEAIFSYCGAKVKIDTDRHVGPERALVRCQGEPVGHVTTGEYGSQMLSIGGVHHLTGGSKREGRVTCDTIMDLCNRKPVEMTIDDGVTLVVEAGRAPVVNGEPRRACGWVAARPPSACSPSSGSNTSTKSWWSTTTSPACCRSTRRARCWARATPGIKIKGRKSTPGRYFQVAEPGTGWGGTNVSDPLSILRDFDPKHAWPGLTLLMVSTTGDHYGYFVLDDDLRPVEHDLPPALQLSVERIQENCEPALCSVMFIGGAGGSLRAGVTENPVNLTRSVKDMLTYVSSGGAPVFVWPGGGITFMVDVTRMPDNSFGYVPTPAIVAPIEFTLRLEDYRVLGGHMDDVVRLEDVQGAERRSVAHVRDNPWPMAHVNFRW
jgi:6-hydroxynicotinate reductase